MLLESATVSSPTSVHVTMSIGMEEGSSEPYLYMIPMHVWVRNIGEIRSGNDTTAVL